MKETKKQREARINATIQRAVYGWSIPMMKLGVVSAAGHLAADNDQDITAAVVAVLEQIAERT